MDKFFGTQKRLYTTSRGGYITLISVLVVGAVGTAITVSLLLLGLGAGRTSFSAEESALARGFANSCAESALAEIRDAELCVGGAAVTFDLGACTAVTSPEDSLCVINAVGTVSSVTRRVQVVLSSVSPIVVDVWQEVADF